MVRHIKPKAMAVLAFRAGQFLFFVNRPALAKLIWKAGNRNDFRL